MDLHNKTAVITGAASGLGAELAKELVKQHCHLALIDIDEAGLQAFANKLQAHRQKVTIHIADISDESKVASVSHEIIEQHGAIDILINNAAIANSLPFEQQEVADHRHIMDVNFWGTVYCTKYFLPCLKQQPCGRLINIISGFAITGFPGKTAYASSKGAIMAFTKSLRIELAGTMVRASIVIPPPMATNIVKAGKHIDAEKRSKEMAFMIKNGMQPQEVASRIVRKVKSGRFRIVVGYTMFVFDAAARLFPSLSNNLTARFRRKIDFF